MERKILIMGLPGAGKTTLAAGLAPRLNAVHFNADEVRKNVNKDLGFSEADRVEHALDHSRSRFVGVPRPRRIHPERVAGLFHTAFGTAAVAADLL